MTSRFASTFSSVKLTYCYLLSQLAFTQFFTYFLMRRLFVNRIMCRWFVYFYTFRNKLSVPLTVVIIFFRSIYNKTIIRFGFVLSRITKRGRDYQPKRTLRQITFTETLIVLDITKTESNYCLLLFFESCWNHKLRGQVSKETLVLRRWGYYKVIWFHQLSWKRF